MGRKSGKIPDRFPGKTWIFRAQIAFALFFGVMWLVIGVVFSSGKMKNAQGQPVSANIGYGMLGAGVACFVYTALDMVNLRARKEPVVRIYREGVELDRYSCDFIDEREQGLTSLHLISAVLSGRAGARYFRVRWPEIEAVGIGGGLGKRGLVVEGTFTPGDPGAPTAHRLVLPESRFRGRLEPVVEAINHHANQTEALPSWGEHATAMA